MFSHVLQLTLPVESNPVCVRLVLKKTDIIKPSLIQHTVDCQGKRLTLILENWGKKKKGVEDHPWRADWYFLSGLSNFGLAI